MLPLVQACLYIQGPYGALTSALVEHRRALRHRLRRRGVVRYIVIISNNIIYYE